MQLGMKGEVVVIIEEVGSEVVVVVLGLAEDKAEEESMKTPENMPNLMRNLRKEPTDQQKMETPPLDIIVDPNTTTRINAQIMNMEHS